ncbi:cold-shock protein [Pedobacter alluvionis]|uniref:Cold shock domain-containing protein n=1 Tax=Pedobacter alluvionis TaxID=475253 RepID=A0A497XT38_9SPHI|nr:cold shock domain-containing protein [Pedobacter alluvionis]RLJ72610.1 CspA family cold shock protein [Pedobacter alluvionis]TFB28078.1 cold shock domain-containing protein [Pedobacter alluvionis]
MQGTVKFYNESKGFGFIITEDGDEVFVHVTGLIDKISQNNRVEFEMAQGKKGPNAVNVKLIQ